MNRAEYAVELQKKGYNCAQAVACSFAEELGVDEALLYAATEGFGGGMGCGQSICGALAGAAVVAGMKTSDGDTEHPGQTKRMSTRNASMILKIFKEKAGALTCFDIKGGGSGKPLTTCPDCVRIGVQAAEEVLGL